MNYSQLFNRAVTLQSQINTKRATLEQLKQQSTTLISNLQTQKQTLSLYEQSLTTLQAIVNQLSTVQISYLNNLLNTALQTIFFDHNYSVTLNITDQRNTKNLEIIFNNDSIPTRVQDNGFGVQAVIRFYTSSIFHPLSQTITYFIYG